MIAVVFVMFFALVLAWLLAPRPSEAAMPAPAIEPAPSTMLVFAETPA